MRRFSLIVIGAVLVVSFVFSGPVAAQLLGQMTPAQVIGNGVGSGGGYIYAGEDFTSFIGSFRYGMNNDTESRLRLGMVDSDDGDLGVVLGGDLKYQLWDYNEFDSTNLNPFDLAMGFGLEFANPEHYRFLSFGGSIIGSYPITLKNKRTIEPYARLNFRIQRETNYRKKVEDRSETGLEVGTNFGAMFSLTDLVDFTVELQIDDDVALLFGVDLMKF